MFDDLSKYKTKGHFSFKNGDSLVTVSKNVSNSQGVYYILRHSRGEVELVYIGKAGTIKEDGSFKKQTLRGRIRNRVKKQSRESFFESKFIDENIDRLEIYWYVTINNKFQDIPGYVEALLLQRYFEMKRKLPPWNNCF
jgi:hypothetical protein